MVRLSSNSYQKKGLEFIFICIWIQDFNIWTIDYRSNKTDFHTDCAIFWFSSTDFRKNEPKKRSWRSNNRRNTIKACRLISITRNMHIQCNATYWSEYFEQKWKSGGKLRLTHELVEFSHKNSIQRCITRKIISRIFGYEKPRNDCSKIPWTLNAWLKSLGYVSDCEHGWKDTRCQLTRFGICFILLSFLKLEDCQAYLLAIIRTHNQCLKAHYWRLNRTNECHFKLLSITG